jgi:hypothetical protein
MTQGDLATRKYSLLRCILDENLEPIDVWLAHDIIPHMVPLGQGVSAFVYRSRKGYVHIFVNSSLSDVRKIDTLCHEVKHVIEDMPDMGRVVGLDMHHQPFEIQADRFLQEVAAAYAVK